MPRQPIDALNWVSVETCLKAISHLRGSIPLYPKRKGEELIRPKGRLAVNKATFRTAKEKWIELSSSSFSKISWSQRYSSYLKKRHCLVCRFGDYLTKNKSHLIRSHGQAVKTVPFHGTNPSSILGGITSFRHKHFSLIGEIKRNKYQLKRKMCSLLT